MRVSADLTLQRVFRAVVAVAVVLTLAASAGATMARLAPADPALAGAGPLLAPDTTMAANCDLGTVCGAGAVCAAAETARPAGDRPALTARPSARADTGCALIARAAPGFDPPPPRPVS